MKTRSILFGIILSLNLTVFLYTDIHGQAQDSVTIPRWRATMIAEDLIRLEEFEDTNRQLQELISQYKLTVALRDKHINTLMLINQTQQKQLSLTEDREKTWQEETIHWKQEARKYKRQRNLYRAGAVVVVGGIVWSVLKGTVSVR